MVIHTEPGALAHFKIIVGVPDYHQRARTTHLAPITPLGRLGRPDDVADIVAFLTGHDGRWVTGQNLRASGGLP